MAKRLSSGFEILAVSDVEFEGMTVELVFGRERVAQLSMERGAAHVEVRILSDFVNSSFAPVFPLDAYLEALHEAKALLVSYPDPISVTSE